MANNPFDDYDEKLEGPSPLSQRLLKQHEDEMRVNRSIWQRKDNDGWDEEPGFLGAFADVGIPGAVGLAFTIVMFLVGWILRANGAI